VIVPPWDAFCDGAYQVSSMGLRTNDFTFIVDINHFVGVVYTYQLSIT
jgi:hypothetical protein